MKGSIAFEYDKVNDLVIATTHGVSIENDEDLHIWYKLYKNYFEKFGCKVDMIIDLSDGFTFAPALGAAFGELRTKIHGTFVQHSCRVSPNRITKTFVQTSAVRAGLPQHADSCETIGEAVQYLLAIRKRAADAASEMRAT